MNFLNSRGTRFVFRNFEVESVPRWSISFAAFSSPQWYGIKIVSGRMVLTTRAGKILRPELLLFRHRWFVFQRRFRMNFDNGSGHCWTKTDASRLIADKYWWTIRPVCKSTEIHHRVFLPHLYIRLDEILLCRHRVQTFLQRDEEFWDVRALGSPKKRRFVVWFFHKWCRNNRLSAFWSSTQFIKKFLADC